MQTQRLFRLPEIYRHSVALLVVLLLVVPVLLTRPAHAAPALVQSSSAAQAGASTISASFSAAPTAGNLLIVVCSTGLSRTITTPSGFSVAINQSGTPTQAIYYKKAAGTETTLSCTFNSSANIIIQIYEYSGQHGYMALDAVNTVASTGSGTTFSSGSVTTTNANDLIFASVIIDTGSTLGIWGNTFTGHEANGVTSGKSTNRVYGGGADFTATTVGTYSTSVSSSNSTAGNWRGQIVAFRSLASPVLLTADIVDASGASVSSPSASLSPLGFAFGCQTANGTLGTSAQRIRVINNTDNPAWTLSLAATSGPGALYSSGTATYDFNNPASSGCTGGQLSLNVANGTLAGVSGCSTTGVALGTNSAFSQGVVDSLTLATGNSSAYIDCAWDVTNIPLTQKVPADQASGSYAINLTLTVVAN